MESSPNSEAILALGEALVEELKTSYETPTLSRWMAHYIAELMSDVQDKPNENGASAEAAKAILHLWSQREQLPRDAQPFHRFNGLIDVLHTLDLHSRAPRYYRTREDSTKGLANEERTWLNVMSAVDQAARVLISFCLDAASSEARHSGQKWIAVAEALGDAHDPDVHLVRFILANASVPTDSDPEELRSEKAKKAIAALDRFTKATTLISSVLEAWAVPKRARRRTRQQKVRTS